MKLLINREDIIKAFVAKTGFEAHEIEIQMDSMGESTSYPSINLNKASIHNPDVRIAIASIFDEGANLGRNFNNGSGVFTNKISLIKAVRTVIPGTGLKDAKDYVENILLSNDV